MADGRLRVDAAITRSGVFKYTNPDGSIRREYRPPEEVFKADSMATFEQVPVTNDHPPVMLTSENAKTYAVGASGDSVRRDGDRMIASLMVFDKPTADAMERGKRQVSNGYHCDIVKTPGVTPDGEHYDVMQTNIRGNHIAIVTDARAGASAAVRMDGASFTLTEPHAGDTSRKDTFPMDLETALKENGALKARCDAAEMAASAAKAGQSKAEGERDAAISAADQAAKARKDATDAYPAAVKARASLLAKAGAVLPAETVAKFDAMDDRAIMADVVKLVDKFDCSDVVKFDASYVRARYEGAIERFDVGAKSLADARPAGELPAKPGAPAARVDEEDESAAAARMDARSHAAWKNHTGVTREMLGTADAKKEN